MEKGVMMNIDSTVQVQSATIEYQIALSFRDKETEASSLFLICRTPKKDFSGHSMFHVIEQGSSVPVCHVYKTRPSGQLSSIAVELNGRPAKTPHVSELSELFVNILREKFQEFPAYVQADLKAYIRGL